MAKFVSIFFINKMLLILTFCGNWGTNAANIGAHNESVSQLINARHSSDIAALDNMGQVALKMVNFLAAAQDEKVEMKSISEFVTSLSKAVSIIKNPQIPQLQEINGRIDNLEQEKEELTKQSMTLRQKLDESEKKILQLEKKLNDFNTFLELSDKKKIGFTATATSSQSLSSGTILKFEQVQVNYGSHYDPAVSTFTCPLSGLYVMSVTLTAYSSNNIQAKLVVGGTTQFNLYNRGHSSHQYNSVSESGLVECRSGIKIWIEATGTGQIYSGQRTLFSGYLYKTISAEDFHGQ